MRFCRIIGWVIGIAVTFSVIAPCQAAPRLTLKLQNVTLPEAIQRLRREYGWKLELGASIAPSTKRASFDWRAATVGTVFRQLSAAYGVGARLGERPGLYRFEASQPSGGETQLREGVAVTLRRLRQEEVRTQAIGAAGATVERSLDVLLAVRPLEGDPDVLYGLDRLRGVDDLGNEVRPVMPGFLRRMNESLPGSAPDEWLLRIPLEGTLPQSKRLQSLEGEVLFYRSAKSHRFETPLGEREIAPLQAGPMRISAISVEQHGALLRGGYAVTWPKEFEVSSSAAAMAGMIAPWGRLADGTLVPIPVSYSAIYADEKGEQSARMVFDPVGVGGPITALVWDVMTKSEPDRRIVFRFERLPLPLAPGSLASVSAATASLVIALKRAGAPAVGEVAIGLSPKRGAGWGPVRWTTTETDDQGSARLEGLSPGTWRVLIRHRPRSEDGTLGPEKAAKLRAGDVVTLTKGKAQTLQAEIMR